MHAEEDLRTMKETSSVSIPSADKEQDRLALEYRIEIACNALSEIIKQLRVPALEPKTWEALRSAFVPASAEFIVAIDKRSSNRAAS